MSVQTPQSRTWPKIFAARGDGPGKGISPLYLTPSVHGIPSTENKHGDAGKPHQEYSVQIEEMFQDKVSERRFSSQKIGKKQLSINDEEALAGIMKEISNEVESFQTLYNNQWFSNKNKALGAMKTMQHSTKPDALTNIVEVDEIPLKVSTNKDTHTTENVLNNLSIQDAVTQSSNFNTREQDRGLERDLSKLSLSQKTVSPHPSQTESTTNEKGQKKAGNMTSATARSVSTLTDSDRQDYKKTVSASSKQVTQTQNVGTTSNNISQAQTCDDTNEVTGAQSGNVSENPLTDAERQTFKEAINAMNAESEREEKRRAAKASSKSLAARRSGLLRAPKEHRKSAGAVETSKEHRKSAAAAERTPIWTSSSIARVDMKKYNRQSVVGKVAQSATNKPQDVRRASDTQAEKQRTMHEPLMRREMQEKQKAAIYHGFPYTKPKSLTSIPNTRNGNFQAGFVKPVPLETGVLHVSPSAPLVSKHYSRKNLPPMTSQSKAQRRHPEVK